MSAASVRLGDVATFVRGITFKPADVLDEVTANAVGCMRTKNVQAQLDETDVWFLPQNFVTNKNQILQEGDLLVSTANSWNLVGKACWVPKLNYECTFGGFISALRATDALIDRRYLYYWFTSAKIQAKLRSFGNKTTNISNLSIKRANDLVIPLPPLAQQQRIAAILDKAAEIKAKREQAIAKLDELAQSTYVEMFESKNKKTMSTVTVQDICEFKYGKSLPEQNRTGGDVKVYGSNGVVGFHNQPLTSGETIIVGRKGSFGEINFCDTSCYPIDTTFYIDGTATKQNLTWLRFALGRLGLNKMNKSAAVPGLSREDAYRQVIFLPAQAEQIVFERKIKCIENEVKTQNSSLAGALSLIQSLQHQAFTTGFNA